MRWQDIENDKEKYSAYLCSREWAEKREKVRERAGNTCERCKTLPMGACHHMTYERKYSERLEDLQAICNPCHEFTHGKNDFDPCESKLLLSWLLLVKEIGTRPMPVDLLYEMKAPCHRVASCSAIRRAILSAIYIADDLDRELDERVTCSLNKWITEEAGFMFPIARLESELVRQWRPLVYIEACRSVGLPFEAIQRDLIDEVNSQDER